jgi:DNA-binding response OmpR family regulator
MIAVVHTRSVAVGIALNRCLTTFGHQPVMAKEGAAVFDLMTRDDPELVIVDATSGDGSWPGMVRAIREQSTYRFVAVLGTGGPSEVVTAYHAGADEYFRFPFEPSEFGARLSAAERIMRYVRSPGGLFDEGPILISELTAWADIEATLTKALADTLCVACQRVDEPFPSGQMFSSCLKFSLAKPRGSVTLHLVMAEPALVAITGLLLGSVSTEQGVLIDACKEVLNTLGGTFKRGALPEHDFTTGIPEMSSLEMMRQSARGARFKKSWTIGWGKHVVGLQATIACDDVQMVPLHSLTEGMVLADDVRNPLGVLIAPRGTHLTESAIKRLYGVLGGSTSLRVSNVA